MNRTILVPALLARGVLAFSLCGVAHLAAAANAPAPKKPASSSIDVSREERAQNLLIRQQQKRSVLDFIQSDMRSLTHEFDRAAEEHLAR